MKLAGFLVLVTGWIIVAAALALLKPGPAQTGFIVAGIGVEIEGLILVVRSHPTRPEPGRAERTVRLRSNPTPCLPT